MSNERIADASLVAAEARLTREAKQTLQRLGREK
jgi:hypothetical protein